MKIVVLYTMEGCPYCTMIKEEMDKKNIYYLDRDIENHQNEFDEFIEETGVDYVPAMILMTLDENQEPKNVKFLAPERDFNDINEGVVLAEKYILN
jgi:glutaredoxin